MILEKDKLNYQGMSQAEIEDEFLNACANGYLDIVQYLLTSSDISNNPNVHTKDNNYNALEYACSLGKIDVVKYLLTSSELSEHANIESEDYNCFILACSCGQIEVIKYLLTSIELKAHANIHAQKDYALMSACVNESLDLINYFILEYNMSISDELIHELKKEDNSGSEYALKLINSKNLNNKLNDNLEIKSVNTPKVKV